MHVFGFMPLVDVSRAMGVCRAFNQWLQDDAIWKPLFLAKWDLRTVLQSHACSLPPVRDLAQLSARAARSLKNKEPVCPSGLQNEIARALTVSRNCSWRDLYMWKLRAPASFILMDEHFELPPLYSPVSQAAMRGSKRAWARIEHQENGRKYAVCKYSHVFESRATALPLLRLLQAMRQMGQHEHILNLVDMTPPASLERFEHVFAIFETMPTSLRDVLSSSQVLTESHMLWIVGQLVSALAHAQACGIVHGDVNPSRVMLDSECTVKLAGFDFALPIDASTSSPLASQSDVSRCGSAHLTSDRRYLAPEALLEGATVSSARDVFALGCVLVEMHTRRALFSGRDRPHQLRQLASLLGLPDDEFLAAHAGARSALADLAANPSLPRASSLGLAERAARLLDFCPELRDSVSSPVMHLIASMLALDPTERISLQDLLVHPLLRDYMPERASAHTPPSPAASIGLADVDASRDDVRALVLREIERFRPLPVACAGALPASRSPPHSSTSASSEDQILSGSTSAGLVGDSPRACRRQLARASAQAESWDAEVELA